jgi:4-hydroxyacetophenone monooxygenase
VNINKDFLSDALQHASFPVLAATLVHVTGDVSILTKLPKPKLATLGETQGYLTDTEKETIKNIAIDLLLQFFEDQGKKKVYVPDESELHQIMNYIVGHDVSLEYVPMMLQELGISNLDKAHREVFLDQSNVNLQVLIIGAGMSGILSAIKLSELGIKYKLYEKSDGVGGPWHDNAYPGSRVDIANHFYSYSFEENHRWSEYFSRQPELKNYFEGCFDKYELENNTQFNTEVTSMQFNPESSLWTVNSCNDNQDISENFNLIISCVGQLNYPKIPEITGLKDFNGKIFHTARWPKQDCISGKNVAVIGAGASAFQIVPSIADDCKELTIFQRSAPWMFPNPNYHKKVDEGKKWLLENLPCYSRWYRFLLFWPGSDQLLNSLIVDPKWPTENCSINKENELMRQVFEDAMLNQISDDSLIEKVIPNYPPFGKRMLQDNGAWLDALHKSNVNLVTDKISCITTNGVEVKNELHQFDTIILATGFRAQEFFFPIKVDGGNGDFLEEYRDSPESYLGITFSNLPNFFAAYGPSTNLAHAGSIIFNSECQLRYICSAIKYLVKNNHKRVQVRKAVVKKYQADLEARLSKTVWQHPKVSSWYQNSDGKVVTTSPWRLVEYWNWTNNFNANDYEF